MERLRNGKCQVYARSRSSASLARQPCGGAVTETLIARPPSAVAAIASRRSALARGDSRIATHRPSRVKVIGPSSKVFEHQVAQEVEQQNQYYRRDVDTTEIGQNGTDRPQQRVGNAPQKIADRGDGPVVAVDDAESEEPA